MAGYLVPRKLLVARRGGVLVVGILGRDWRAAHSLRPSPVGGCAWIFAFCCRVSLVERFRL